MLSIMYLRSIQKTFNLQDQASSQVNNQTTLKDKWNKEKPGNIKESILK